MRRYGGARGSARPASADRDLREMEPLIMARLRGLALLPLLLAGCDAGCQNSEIARVDTTDGAYSAVTFDRACGATTGPSTQISVVASGTRPEGGGNAFRADAGMPNQGRPWAEARWLSERHLLIRYRRGARIFEQAPEVAGVRITYEAVAATP